MSLLRGGSTYEYDGLGNRISQTVNSVVTEYLNDVQPGLTKVLRQSVGADDTFYIHTPRGVLYQQNPNGDWLNLLTDGLGSTRVVVDENGSVLEGVFYDPFGNPDTPLTNTDIHFTGEFRDANGLQYHRARYYDPSLGVWVSLDPYEGKSCTPMSLNRYMWVEGNTPNMVDPGGMQAERRRNCMPSADIPGAFICFPSCQGYVIANGFTTSECIGDLTMSLEVTGSLQEVNYFDENRLTAPLVKHECEPMGAPITSTSFANDIRDTIVARIQYVVPSNIVLNSVVCYEQNQKERSRLPDPIRIPVPARNETRARELVPQGAGALALCEEANVGWCTAPAQSIPTPAPYNFHYSTPVPYDPDLDDVDYLGKEEYIVFAGILFLILVPESIPIAIASCIDQPQLCAAMVK